MKKKEEKKGRKKKKGNRNGKEKEQMKRFDQWNLPFLLTSHRRTVWMTWQTLDSVMGIILVDV